MSKKPKQEPDKKYEQPDKGEPAQGYGGMPKPPRKNPPKPVDEGSK